MADALGGLRKDGLVPDLVFRIRSAEERKSLLFFLEVDMGTETVASPKRTPKDFREKVGKYREQFRSGNYKSFQPVWKATFRGFRLLVLANSLARCEALCSLVREMRPSDFVWLVPESLLAGRGLSDAIWARGGRTDRPAESILGKQMSKTDPLPELKS